MSDIIQGAKELLKLVDEERADLESRGAEPDEYGGFEMWLDATVLYDNAKEVRESIKELAEETWEYSFHVQNTIGMWEHPTPWAGETGKWWETKEDAEESALAAHEYGYPIRIVRRRVSPPEVVNE